MDVLISGSLHIANFNAPKHSRFTVRQAPRCTRPLVKKIGSRLMESGSWQNTWYGEGDFIHTFNEIAVTDSLWCVTFEDFLPRIWHPLLHDWMRRRLAMPNCLALIAMSDYARRKFIARQRGWSGLDAALAKLSIIHPAVPHRGAPKRSMHLRPRLIFVG